MVRSRPPINCFVWLAFSILSTFGLLVNGMSIAGSLFYGILVVGIIYMLINTRDGMIKITEDKLTIIYMRPFWNREIIDLTNVEKIEFQKGKLLSFSLDGDIDRYIKSKDKLILKQQDGDQTILINSRRKDVKLIIDGFNNQRSKSIN